MAETSKIEWTDATLNPIRARDRATGKVGWHCTPASDGCRNCYAEGMNRRLGTGLPYKAQALPQVEMFLDEAMLMKPLRWRKPRKVFLGSMTDIFADFVTDDMLDRIFAMMALTPQHTYQVLTKRAERLRAYMDYFSGAYMHIDRVKAAMWKISDGRTDHIHGGWPLRNVWLGVSAEDQNTADDCIPHLLATPAAVRFVSAEPLLGPIDFERLGTLQSVRAALPTVAAKELSGRPANGDGSICGMQIDAIGERGSSITFFQTPDHMGGFTAASPRQFPRIDWIIVGGESGPGARPMHPDWAREIRDQCAAAGVPFFFKQWGDFLPAGQISGLGRLWNPGCGSSLRGTKATTGRLLYGIEHNAMPAGAR